MLQRFLLHCLFVVASPVDCLQRHWVHADEQLRDDAGIDRDEGFCVGDVRWLYADVRPVVLWHAERLDRVSEPARLHCSRDWLRWGYAVLLPAPVLQRQCRLDLPADQQLRPIQYRHYPV